MHQHGVEKKSAKLILQKAAATMGDKASSTKVLLSSMQERK
jgi:hypothetical protein